MKLHAAAVFVGLLLIFNFFQFSESIRLPFRPANENSNAEHPSKNTTVTDKAPFEFLLALISPYIAAFSKNNSVDSNGNGSLPFYPMNVNFNFNHHETDPKTNATVDTEWEFEFELGSYSGGNQGSAGESGAEESSNSTTSGTPSAKFTEQNENLYQLY